MIENLQEHLRVATPIELSYEDYEEQLKTTEFPDGIDKREKSNEGGVGQMCVKFPDSSGVGSGSLVYIKHDEYDKDIAKMKDEGLGEIFILTCAHNVCKIEKRTGKRTLATKITFIPHDLERYSGS